MAGSWSSGQAWSRLYTSFPYAGGTLFGLYRGFRTDSEGVFRDLRELRVLKVRMQDPA
jgi:hypothetical protein